MLKDITLGQYYPAESCVHRLDPRIKLLAMTLYIVIVFLAQSLYMFIPIAAFAIAAISLSRVPVSYALKSLKPLRWILVFMFALNLFLTQSGTEIVSFWIIKLTTGGIYKAFFISIRLVFLVLGTSLLTLTTTPILLTDGIERIFSPLKVIKFPAHELAMIMTIALRFVPTLLEEADKIMKAQISRGAQIDTGSVFKRVKAMVPILIPLLVGSFRRADELAMAMESRCYHGGEGRTKMRVMKLTLGDGACTLIMICLLAIMIILPKIFPMLAVMP